MAQKPKESRGLWFWAMLVALFAAPLLHTAHGLLSIPHQPIRTILLEETRHMKNLGGIIDSEWVGSWIAGNVLALGHALTPDQRETVLTPALKILNPLFQASIWSLLLVALRLSHLLLMLPAILLAVFVGICDGWARRYIRREELGRESSYIYHHASARLKTLIFLPGMIYLLLPWPINPLYILLPSAILLGVLTCMTVSWFKKYL